MYRSFYTYKVTLTDNTAKIYYELVTYFKNLLQGEFQSYYDAAFEQCSYDNINEKFNDFFITGILDTYDTQISSAPWYLMPVVYHVHRDLIYNEYKGDRDLIFAAAQRDTQNIAPETGNLASLELFRDNVQNFYDKVYGDDGTLHKRVVNDLGYAAPDGTVDITTAQLLQAIEEGSGFKEITYGNESPETRDLNGTASTWYDIPPIINLVDAQGLIDDIENIQQIAEDKSIKAALRANQADIADSKSRKAAGIRGPKEGKEAKAGAASVDRAKAAKAAGQAVADELSELYDTLYDD